MKHVVKLDNEKFKGMTFNVEDPDTVEENEKIISAENKQLTGDLQESMNRIFDKYFNTDDEIEKIETEDVSFSRLLELRTSKGKIYRHFKGDLYLILDLAEHTETGDDLVIYKALYGDCKVYARPLKMFLEKVPEGKPNPTGQTYRLELVNVESVKEK